MGTLTMAAGALLAYASSTSSAAERVVCRQGFVDTTMCARHPIILSCMEAARHCRAQVVRSRASSAGEEPWILTQSLLTGGVIPPGPTAANVSEERNLHAS